MVTAVETHYHTIASGHAYSTVLEGVMYAKKYGMKGLAVTDHGPAMPGLPTSGILATSRQSGRK